MYFFESSTDAIFEIILKDLFHYVEFGNSKFNSLGNIHVNDSLSSWLGMFNDYPNGFSDEEKKFIERQIYEFLGDRFIWFEDVEDIVNFKQQIFDYFGSKNGFYKVLVDIYDEMLKEELLF